MQTMAESKHGFSLLELLVVMVIIAILIGLLFPVLIKARETARRHAAQAEVFELQKAWTAYWDTYGDRPAGMTQAAGAEMNAARVRMLAGENPNQVQFMRFSRRQVRDGMKDPWGELYRVRLIEERDVETRWSYKTRVFPRNIARGRE